MIKCLLVDEINVSGVEIFLECLPHQGTTIAVGPDNFIVDRIELESFSSEPPSSIKKGRALVVLECRPFVRKPTA
jgi:hypothetical protein